MSISLVNHESRITALENAVRQIQQNGSSGFGFPNWQDKVSIPFDSDWRAPYDCFITGCMGIWNGGMGYVMVDGVKLWETSGSNNGDYAGETTFYVPIKAGSVVRIHHTYGSWAHKNMGFAFRCSKNSLRIFSIYNTIKRAKINTPPTKRGGSIACLLV